MFSPTGVRRAIACAGTAALVACAPAPASPPAHPVASEASAVILSAETQAQLAAAERAAQRLSTRIGAARSGYRRLAPPSLPDLNPMVGEHWINERHLRVTSLDPSRPAYVMYYPLPGREQKQVLVGTAYGMVQPLGADPPEGFQGAQDVWHVHVLCTELDNLGSTFTSSAAQCMELGGKPAKHQLAMLHVWFDPENPEGPFAPDNVALPFVAVGLAPPTTGDFRNAARAQRMRKLALALSETYGATPRGGGFIEQNPPDLFARRAGADRTEIRRQIPFLRDAQEAGDPDAFAAAANQAIAAWERIRIAYLDAAPSDVLRQMLDTWFSEAVLSNAHAGTHR